MSRYIKDPSAVLDFVFDWSLWLATGETITASTITASTITASTGITVDSDTFTGTTVTYWLSGGTLNTLYTIVNHITTSAGRQDDRTDSVTIHDR